MEPASSIIKKLGGPQVVADICGKRLTSPYRWQRPKEEGGTGGVIPHWHHAALLDYAAAHGIELKAEEFVQRAPAPPCAEPASPEAA